MRRKGGLLKNFPEFHGDCATSAMFSQRCRKTYWTDLVRRKPFCLRKIPALQFYPHFFELNIQISRGIIFFFKFRNWKALALKNHTISLKREPFCAGISPPPQKKDLAKTTEILENLNILTLNSCHLDRLYEGQLNFTRVLCPYFYWHSFWIFFFISEKLAIIVYCNDLQQSL